MYMPMGELLAGWAEAQLGHPEGFPRATRAIADWEATGVTPAQTYYSLLVAEAGLGVKMIAESASALERGLKLSEASGEGCWRAELLRLKGEIALAGGEEPDHRERCFQSALHWADTHGAKSQQLRAATSLSRFWQQRGKTGQARQLLGSVYGWFTEGFDTPDLREAAALLGTLS